MGGTNLISEMQSYFLGDFLTFLKRRFGPFGGCF